MKRHLVLVLMALLLTTNSAFALFCSQCGQNLADDANFCSACGKACRSGSVPTNTPQPVVTGSPSAIEVHPPPVVSPVIANETVPTYLVTSPCVYLSSRRLERHHPIQVLEYRGNQARVTFVSRTTPYRQTTCWITVGDLERHTTWRPQFRVSFPIPAPICVTHSPKRRHVHAPVIIIDHKRKPRHERHDHCAPPWPIFKPRGGH